MHDWMARVELSPQQVRLLVEDSEGDRLKARLPGRPAHPRALVTLLEGLALWSGAPLPAVLGAGARWDPSCASSLFGDGGMPADSALVWFEVAEPRLRARRIRGVGDFRGVRQLPLWRGAP